MSNSLSLKCWALGCALAAVFPLGLVVRPAAAQEKAKLGEDVGFDQKLDAPLPLDVTLVNEQGRKVQLGDYFGKQPVILMPVYYRCPMLCGLELNGLVSCLRAMELTPGKDFQIVTFSIDPREESQLAAQKKASYLSRYGRPGAAKGWHFLTGREAEIRRLCDAIGFKAVYNAETEQYAHAAGIVVVTPEGRLSRYFYGVEFAPRDLRLGLIESSQNRIGTAADQVLLYCYLYDPSVGKYGLAVMNIVRAGGLLTLIVLGGGIGLMLRREKHKDSGVSETPGA